MNIKNIIIFSTSACICWFAPSYGGAYNLVGGELAIAVSIVDFGPPLLGGPKIAGTYHGGPWRYSISTK